MQVGAMPEQASLEHRIGETGALVTRDRPIEPLAGRIRSAKQVVDAAHAVVELDQQRLPA